MQSILWTGVAVVDKEKCKACGKWISQYVQDILIELIPYEQKHMVQCSSQDKGKDVMAACAVGCIGCRMCAKVCPAEAITVENNIAHIDSTKCVNCGACAENVSEEDYPDSIVTNLLNQLLIKEILVEI